MPERKEKPVMLKLKQKYVGKRIAVRVTPKIFILMTGDYAGNRDNREFILQNAGVLGKYVEFVNGNPLPNAPENEESIDNKIEQPEPVESSVEENISEEAGLKSSDLAWGEAIREIHKIESVKELGEFVEGESRVKVLKAAEKREGELNG